MKNKLYLYFLLFNLIFSKDIINKILKEYFFNIKCIDCNKTFLKKNTSSKCDSCKNWLCENHAQRALKWGSYYRNVSCYRMCDNCCWFEIS